MNVVLDTSVLVKLYHKEVDTAIYVDFFKNNNVDEIYRSAITKIEFESTVWKKYRTKEISQEQALNTIAVFNKDNSTYNFLPITNNIIKQAKKLFTTYDPQGLRSLDSIQLATCIKHKNEANLFLTANALLNTFLIA